MQAHKEPCHFVITYIIAEQLYPWLAVEAESRLYLSISNLVVSSHPHHVTRTSPSASDELKTFWNRQIIQVLFIQLVVEDSETRAHLENGAGRTSGGEFPQNRESEQQPW